MTPETREPELELRFSATGGRPALEGIVVFHRKLCSSLGTPLNTALQSTATDLRGGAALSAVVLVFVEYALHYAMHRSSPPDQRQLLELVGPKGSLAYSAYDILRKETKYAKWLPSFGYVKVDGQKRLLLTQAIDRRGIRGQFVVRLRSEDGVFPWIAPEHISIRLAGRTLSEVAELQQLIHELTPSNLTRWARTLSPLGSIGPSPIPADTQNEYALANIGGKSEVSVSSSGGNMPDAVPSAEHKSAQPVTPHGKNVDWRQKSLDVLHAEASNGNPMAQFHLGTRYERGIGVAIHERETVNWYRRAAEQGLAEAQNALASCYARGFGVLKNYHDAEKWWHLAANQGNTDAQLSFGVMCDQLHDDPEEAVKWIRLAAEAGNPEASEEISYRYFRGKGVEQDETESLKWERLAAEQWHHAAIELDDAKAQYNVGWHYLQGITSETGSEPQKDYDEAVKWLRKSADQGYAKAQRELGSCYQYGRGVKADHAEAFRLFSCAAAHGDAKAFFRLGWCHEYGIGVPESRSEAIKWYRRALEAGDSSAESALDRLGS